MAVLVPVVVRELTCGTTNTNNARRTMADESTECPEHSDTTETDRYARWLEGALYWLHYSKAEIHTLSKRDVNQLAREELARRKRDGALESTPRRVYAWLFVEYTLYRDEEPAYRGGDADV